MLRADVVTACRKYLGVPYQHQGRTRNGMDCIGLVICVVHDLGLSQYDITRYSRVPSGRMMQRILSEHCKPLPPNAFAIGDVLHMAFENQPQHLAIVTDRGIIHSDSRHGVVEHLLDKRWRDRIRAAYRLPGID